MHIIHFTSGATDPLTAFAATTGARFLALMEGQGDSHISCLHLNSNASIHSPSIEHAAALLCVHGRIIRHRCDRDHRRIGSTDSPRTRHINAGADSGREVAK